ncbi:MAG: hypothetical protein II822_02225 [Prevotella sp.]|nr:hypothetical protein [Prevotella sp.]
MTDLTLILTVALAAAFVLVVVGLLLSLFYYRWRLADSHRTLARFIRENILLYDKLEKIAKQETTDGKNRAS